MPQISVIVPVYNVEKYLEECIQSVLYQTFQDWELLLINDGSTDSSGEICETYVKKDVRIKKIDKRNGGQPSALNFGLNIAKGEYVIFLDSDDYWTDYFILEKLHYKAKKYNLDIIRGECKEVNNLGDIIHEYSIYEYNRYNYSNKIVNADFFIDKLVAGKYFMVLYLIKRSIIGKLRYNENRVFLQDAEFNLKLCSLQTIKCMYVPEVFYAYRKHDGAITVKEHPQKFYDALDYTRFCFNLSRDRKCTERYKRFLVNEGIKNFLFDIKVLCETNRPAKEYDELINKYDLHKRRKEVIENVHLHIIQSKYWICFLPLKSLLYYYRIIHKGRETLKKLYHKLHK